MLSSLFMNALRNIWWLVKHDETYMLQCIIVECSSISAALVGRVDYKHGSSQHRWRRFTAGEDLLKNSSNGIL